MIPGVLTVMLLPMRFGIAAAGFLVHPPCVNTRLFV